jgi:hypothetical protein
MHHYTKDGYDRARAWHEVGHYFLARDCGLAATLISIDATLATRNSGRQADGLCSIADLPSAPLFDQVTVYRAGIIASELGGYPYNDGGVGGDFEEINQLTRNLLGDDARAMTARADRRAEQIIRANWAEAQALVERLVRERTIRLDSAPNDKWRAALDQKYGTSTVDAHLRKLGYSNLVTLATQVRRVTLPLQTRAAPVTDVGGDTFRVCWGSGEKVKRNSYDGYFWEDLPPANADLTWMNTGKCPLLDTHNSSRVDDVLGAVVENTAFVQDNKGYASIVLGSKAPVDDIKAGRLRNLSIGYAINSMERNGTADDGLPIFTVKSYRILELSIVPVPADKNAEILRTYTAEVRG